MSNIIKFPPPKQKQVSAHSSAFDAYTDDLGMIFAKNLRSNERAELFKKIKGILRARGIKFSLQPTLSSGLRKNKFTIFFNEIKVGFQLGNVKQQIPTDGWSIRKLQESSDPASSAGLIITFIEGKNHG
ncbi:hypothetical protein OKS68_13725 [Aeromonas veronii]|uniref:hypothetical protein n=1 Tax=Aeromonas veronii TaxID=654 RepID=UPI00226D2A28|nr:hypothetical protein [Aeromonas veronii]MCX9133532.1 hypothetical protein [Aeromonas veronii]